MRTYSTFNPLKNIHFFPFNLKVMCTLNQTVFVTALCANQSSLINDRLFL
jgi:hypothetical protein